MTNYSTITDLINKCKISEKLEIIKLKLQLLDPKCSLKRYKHDIFTINLLNGKLIKCSKTAEGDIEIPYGISDIGNMAFYRCNKIKNISIPITVKHIGEKAFSKCKNLKTVTMQDSIYSIGNHTFIECENLKNVRLSKSIAEIPWGAFAKCRKLSNIEIPKSVKTIKGLAFYECDSLEDVKMCNSTQIEHAAFLDCTKLKNHVRLQQYTEIDSYL